MTVSRPAGKPWWRENCAAADRALICEHFSYALEAVFFPDHAHMIVDEIVHGLAAFLAQARRKLKIPPGLRRVEAGPLQNPQGRGA